MYRIIQTTLVMAALVAVPAIAQAQAVGIGPRMSFIRPEPGVATTGDRYTGGTLRLRTSSRTAIELAMDWRSTTSEDQLVRVRDYPLQGSLLIYPVRAAIAPYVLGGVGWYTQQMSALADGEVIAEHTARRMGYHAGFGAELALGSRLAVFADYRYTYIQFRRNGETDGAGAFGIPGVGSLFEHVGLSHDGAMWTSGVTVRF